MLTYLKIIYSSILLLFAIVIVDAFAAYLATLFHFSFVDVFGDVMLVEVAVLFILAGLMDYSTSIGMEQFKKVFLRAKQQSASDKKVARQQAFVVLTTGVLLFLTLIGLAIYLLH